MSGSPSLANPRVTYGELSALANRVGNALRAQRRFPRRSRFDGAAGFGGVRGRFFWRPQKLAAWPFP